MHKAQRRRIKAWYADETYVIEEVEELKTYEDTLSLMVVEKMNLGGEEEGSGGGRMVQSRFLGTAFLYSLFPVGSSCSDCSD